MDIKLDENLKDGKWQLLVEWPELPLAAKLSVIAGDYCYSQPSEYLASFSSYEEYEYGIFVDGKLIHEHVVGYVSGDDLWDEIKDSFEKMGVQLPEGNPIEEYINPAK